MEVDEARFKHHVERDGVPVVVDFWAAWCGPCRSMAPAFEQVAAELEPAARFLKVDVDSNKALAAQLGVQGIPALFVYRNGEVVGRQAGAMGAAELRNWVKRTARI
jgi:thioredoxin 2